MLKSVSFTLRPFFFFFLNTEWIFVSHFPKSVVTNGLDIKLVKKKYLINGTHGLKSGKVKAVYHYSIIELTSSQSLTHLNRLFLLFIHKKKNNIMRNFDTSKKKNLSPLFLKLFRKSGNYQILLKLTIYSLMNFILNIFFF